MQHPDYTPPEGGWIKREESLLRQAMVKAYRRWEIDEDDLFQVDDIVPAVLDYWRDRMVALIDQSVKELKAEAAERQQQKPVRRQAREEQEDEDDASC